MAMLEQSERLRAAFDSVAGGDACAPTASCFCAWRARPSGASRCIATGALKEREVAIGQLVEPLRAALERTEAQVQALERERRDAFASLRVQIEGLAGGQAQLPRETRDLVPRCAAPKCAAAG